MNHPNKSNPPFDADKKPKQVAVPGKHGIGYSTARHLARMGLKQAMEKQSVTETKSAPPGHHFTRAGKSKKERIHMALGASYGSKNKVVDEDINEAKRPDRPMPKTDLRVGDYVVADTSKEDYPGGHKQRSGKVTRVGEKGVHIQTDDSDEPEWHPYKIVKKHGVAEATGDTKFDSMMKRVAKAPTAKARNAERIRQKKEREEETRAHFTKGGGLGPNPADKLGIRKQGMAEGRTPDDERTDGHYPDDYVPLTKVDRTKQPNRKSIPASEKKAKEKKGVLGPNPADKLGIRKPPGLAHSHFKENYSFKQFKNIIVEKTLTPAELKKREEVAKAIEKDNPNMPMGMKMAIATKTAKKVAEENVDGIGEAFKMPKPSMADKMYSQHQDIRKKAGRPSPEYYKELKTTFDLPDNERRAKTAELKKKYNIGESNTTKERE